MSLVLAGIVSTQFGATLGATLFDDVGPAGASFLRVAFAALVLAIVVRPRLRSYPPDALRLAALFGLALGVMNLTFYEALDRIPLGVAVAIEFLGPLAVAVAGSRRPVDLLWVALSAGGILLLANPGGVDGIDPVGLAFALAAGVCWGAYIVLAARVGPRLKGADGVAIAMVVAVLVPAGPGLAEAGSALLSVEALALGAAAGILSSAIPYSLETEALRRIPRHVFSVLMSLEPGVAAGFGFLVLGQALDARELVAIGLVVVASAGASRNVAQQPEA